MPTQEETKSVARPIICALVTSKKSMADRTYLSVIIALASCTSFTVWANELVASSAAVAAACAKRMPFPMKRLGSGGSSLSRTLTANRRRETCVGGMSRACVLARHVSAARTSKAVTFVNRPSLRVCLFKDSTFSGDKEKEPKKLFFELLLLLLFGWYSSSFSSSSGEETAASSSTSHDISRCGNSIRGGERGFRTVRSK